MRAVSRSLISAVLPKKAMDHGASNPAATVDARPGTMLPDPADGEGASGAGEDEAGDVGAHAARAIAMRAVETRAVETRAPAPRATAATRGSAGVLCALRVVVIADPFILPFESRRAARTAEEAGVRGGA